jgi:hypothetical protein
VARTVTVLLALCALSLVACGGDDEKEVEQTVRDFVKATDSRDTKKFCDELVSQQFLEQSTGAKGDNAREACHSQLKSLKGVRVRLESIESTEVRGDKATVRAVLSSQGQKQDQLLRLRKESGDWKLAGGSGG